MGATEAVGAVEPGYGSPLRHGERGGTAEKEIFSRRSLC